MSKKFARIIGSGVYLPEKRLTNKDLEALVDTSDEWIVTRTGMRERRIAAENEYASTMGIHAAKQAIESAGIDPKDIDFIAVATTTPDYIFPSTGALIQHEIGAVNAAAFDFQAACTGYLYGLAIAKGFIESGIYKNVLLVATEKMSSIVDYTDRNTCILFGDGAAANVISSEGKGLVIKHVCLGTDGAEADLLTMPGGGVRLPPSEQSVKENQHTIHMSGRGLFKHAVRRMAQSIEEALEQANVTEDEITWMVPHQANIRIIEAVGKRFSIPKEKTYLTVHKYGNTSASSVPIALADLMDEHELKSGDYLLMPACGAGLTWGTAILKQL